MNNHKIIQQNQTFSSELGDTYIDYKKNNRYFNTHSYIPPLLLIAAGIIMICFININTTIGICGWVPFICGIIILAIKLKYRVTDKEYDLSINSFLFDIKKGALKKLNINEQEIEQTLPVSFDNFDIENSTKQKKGKDGIIRTNLYKSIMLFFTKYEIHYYEFSFETTADYKTEKTDIYFFEDIVSISCISNHINIDDNFFENETVQITTKGGNSFSITFNNSEQARQTINTMRSLLRLNKLKT